MSAILELGRQKRKDEKFQVILSHTGSLKGACASRNPVSKQKETLRHIYFMAVGSSFHQATSTPVQHAENVLVSLSCPKQHTLLANTKTIQVRVAL